LLYSQSSFSPDGRTLAFTAQRKGKDVLYLLDVRKRKVIRRIDTHLEGVTGPSWSPDGNGSCSPVTSAGSATSTS
jgi:Tol biopolymer transport system component